MAKHSQMKFDWMGALSGEAAKLPDSHDRAPERLPAAEEAAEAAACAAAPSSQLPSRSKPMPDPSRPPSTRAPLPCPSPLPEALEKKVFGEDENGDAVVPDDQEITVITRLQGERLIAALDRLKEVDGRLENKNDPNRAELIHQKDVEHSACLGLLALYAEDFGEKAARELEAWAHDQRDNGEGEVDQYDPGHPWHYYVQGDAAAPIPVEQIVAAAEAGLTLEPSLPNSPAKRSDKLATMLEDQREQLTRDRDHYQALVDQGCDALSDHDRNLANGEDDELAWASAVALKYNHIRNGLGRVVWLEVQLQKAPAAKARRRK